MQVCRDIIKHLQTEPDSLCSIIPRDFWIWFRNQVPKQSVEVTKTEESKIVIVMLIMLFNVRGIVHIKFLPDNQSTKSTRRSHSVCFTQCMRRDASCGRTNCGCFTMLMNLLIIPWAPFSFWLIGTVPYRNNSPIYQILLSMIFFLFSIFKRIFKKTYFEGMEAIKRDIPEESFQHCIEAL